VEIGWLKKRVEAMEKQVERGEGRGNRSRANHRKGTGGPAEALERRAEAAGGSGGEARWEGPLW